MNTKAWACFGTWGRMRSRCWRGSPKLGHLQSSAPCVVSPHHMLEEQSELVKPTSISPCSLHALSLLGYFGIPPHLVVGHPSSALGGFLSLISIVELIHIKWVSCSESARDGGIGGNFAVVLLQDLTQTWTASGGAHPVFI